MTLDYNLVWNGGSPSPTWEGNAMGGVEGDPLLQDEGDGAFRPAVGSAAVDAGVSSPVMHDRDRLPRPVGAAPDLGAYELQ